MRATQGGKVLMITYSPGLKRVKPLTGDLLKQYCPPMPLNKNGQPLMYPAIMPIRRVTNYKSWTMDWEVVNWPSAWTKAIIKDIGQVTFNYWKSPPNGQWFPEGHPAHFYLCTFPENEIEITDINNVPAKGGWYGKVSVLKLTNSPPAFSKIPYYQFGYQYDMNNNGVILSCDEDTGHSVHFPLASSHPNDDWILLNYLEDT